MPKGVYNRTEYHRSITSVGMRRFWSLQKNPAKVISCYHCGKNTTNPKFCSRECGCYSRNNDPENRDRISKALIGRSFPYMKQNGKMLNNYLKQHPECRKFPRTEEMRRKVSQTLKKKYELGELFVPSRKGVPNVGAYRTHWKNCEFVELKVRSGWEKDFATLLSFSGLIWCYEGFSFILEDGSIYTPDFFIDDFKLFVEIKPIFMQNDPYWERKIPMIRRAISIARDEDGNSFSFMLIGDEEYHEISAEARRLEKWYEPNQQQLC